MRPRFHTFITIALLVACMPATASGPGPRALASTVADTIATHYFDPARGRTYAERFRADAAAGRFDAPRDAESLASAMTDVLRRHDRHFAVRYTGAGGDAARTSRPGRAPMPAHGIARVDVLPGEVGYLELRMFDDFAFDDARAPARHAIDDALARLIATETVIVDLRDNGGGSPAMVGYLASAFLAPGSAVFNTFHWQDGTATEAPGEWHAHPRPEVPLYVLIGSRTASAAESFAYTLKHAGRATIVGAPSAGAANPGRSFEIGDGYSVFVSTGSPVNPKTGGNWEGTGVQPDIAVAGRDALDVALAHAASANRERLGAAASHRTP